MNVLEYGKAFYKIKRYEVLHTFKRKPLQFNQQVETIAETLVRQGYVVLEGYFSEEQCTSIRSEIDRVLVAHPNFVETDKHDSDHRLFGANYASAVIDDLFWKDEFLNSVRNCFYEHNDIVGFTLAARLDAKAANLGSGGGWHRDMIYGRQLKSIGYFSDVTLDQGPFQFLEQSHKASSILETIAQCNIGAFQNRFSQEDVNKISQLRGYHPTTFTGEAGTLLIVDTTSIHRGMPIQSGTRYALTNYWFETKIPEHIEQLVYKG